MMMETLNLAFIILLIKMVICKKLFANRFPQEWMDWNILIEEGIMFMPVVQPC